MSWKASAWAKEQRLGSPAAKSILLCLADYADPERAECWPSQTQLASDAEVSERTAREWLQRLEDWGLLARARRSRANGARASDMIVLHLDARVRDGAERCREIKASDGEADESLPANSAGRANRQSDTDPTGNEAQPTGNQCRAYKEEPSIEPPTGTSQPARQGARESADAVFEKEDPKAVETAFWRVVKDWPRFAGMPKEPAKRVWFKLSAEERRLAEDRLPGWMAMLKANRKDHVPAPATYFKERLWQSVPVPEAVEVKPTAIYAPPFGPVWGGILVKTFLTSRPVDGPPPRGFMAEQLARDDEAGRRARLTRQAVHGWPMVNAMHEQALSRKGVTVAPELAERLKPLMEAVPVGTEMWDRWREHHEAQGWPWIPDPGGQRVAFFPTGGPDRLEAFEQAIRDEGTNDDGGTRQAAE